VDQQAHRPNGAASAISWLTCLTEVDRLRLDRFVSETIALDQVEEAFAKMQRNEVLRSVVVFPDA
jgi:Zn-dependent alcohol dehydrogenase